MTVAMADDSEPVVRRLFTACVIAALTAAVCVDRTAGLHLPPPPTPPYRTLLVDQLLVEPRQYRRMHVRVSGYLVNDPGPYALLYPSKDVASRDFAAHHVSGPFVPILGVAVDVDFDVARDCDRYGVTVYGTADALFGHNREGIRDVTRIEGCPARTP